MGIRFSTPTGNPATYTSLLRLLSSALLVGVVVWPLASGYAYIHEEHLFCIRSVTHTLVQNVQQMWNSRFYRVLDIIAGYLCDPATLDARWTVLLQVPPLAAIILAIRVMVRRIGLTGPNVVPLAIIWFLVHSATSVALWIPTVGQTWSAAVGVWLGLAAWDTARMALGGLSVPWFRWAVLGGLAVLGPNVKETFYGWAGAVACTMAISWASVNRRRRGSQSALLGATLVVALPSIIHFAARLVWGGMGQFVDANAGRYQLQLGENIPRNIALSLVGQLAATPVHYIHRASFMQVIAIAGVVLSGLLAFVGVRGQFRHESRASDQTNLRLVLVGTSVLATCVTWPVERISELYLMGPNVVMAVIVAAGAHQLWRAPGCFRTRFCGRVVVLAAYAVGTLGLASRAMHMRVSWLQGRYLYSRVAEYQMHLPPRASPRTIGIPGDMMKGWRHSQYVMPPAVALNTQRTAELRNLLFPDQKIRFVILTDESTQVDHILDDSGLPRRMNW